MWKLYDYITKLQNKLKFQANVVKKFNFSYTIRLIQNKILKLFVRLKIDN